MPPEDLSIKIPAAHRDIALFLFTFIAQSVIFEYDWYDWYRNYIFLCPRCYLSM